MAKTQEEISQITTRLTLLSTNLRPTSSTRIAPLKPSAPEYRQIQSDMHRLRVLRGLAREGERAPAAADAWDMFLDEFFGPRLCGSVAQPRRPASPYPGVYEGVGPVGVGPVGGGGGGGGSCGSQVQAQAQAQAQCQTQTQGRFRRQGGGGGGGGGMVARVFRGVGGGGHGNGNGNGGMETEGRQRQRDQYGQLHRRQQQNGSSVSVSVSASGPSSHVRFQSPLPKPRR